MQAVPEAKASEVSFNEGVLRLAAVHKRAVQFRYAKLPTAPIEMRSFVPDRLFTTEAGYQTVVGPDPDRDGEFRMYRLDRIKGEVQFA
jgi:hypothetical protein